MHDTEPKDIEKSPADSAPAGAVDAQTMEQVLAEAEAAVDAVRQDDRDDEEFEEVDIESSEDDVAAERVVELEDELAVLQDETVKLRDKWLRSAAELENYKKRVKRDMEDAQQRDMIRLLRDFLPTVDNLERALGSVASSGEQLGDGIRLVQREFLVALSKNDIEPVIAVGTPFDPSFHEALQQMDSAEHAPGIVMVEFERGYVRKGRLLRPSRVVVASSKSTGAPPASDEDAPGSGEEG
jgi:molecular chaperone GrpE